MTWTAGFNFRATSGYVTDATGETYSIGEAYPTTRSMAGGGASVTFGWNTTVSNIRDRNSASPYAPELSGINFVAAGGSAITFRVDLPATGSYIIRVGAGDAGSTTNNAYFTVFDGTTALITETQTNTSSNFIDASLAALSASAWQSSNTGVTKTFATTTAKITINVPTSGAAVLAHFRLTAVAAATLPSPIIVRQAVNRASTF